MKMGYEVFLTVCEEMSITKAAKRLFITQQAASDHIRRLEEHYGLKLFHRKPEFTLTEEGKILLDNLQNIRIMENNMDRLLGQYAAGTVGNFKVGISTSRAPVILPLVLPEFSRQFPLVNISFDEEDTQILEERLRKGAIDIFIGVNTTPDDSFEIHTVAGDEIMLVVSEKLMKQYLTDYQNLIHEKNVDLRKFAEVPFVLPNFQTGKVNHVIREFLNSQNVKLKVKFNISDSETQLGICTTGECAALCPRMLLGYAKRYNQNCSKEERLHMFSLEGLYEKLRIDLVTHKHVIYPPYVQCFIDLVKEKVETMEKAAINA